jgi:hypothetical protein
MHMSNTTPISMYDVSVPLFVQMLGGLRDVMGKGEAFAEANKVDPQVLLDARLFPNMFALSRQILVATEFAKAGAARLAAIDIPAYQGPVGGFAESYARIDAAISFFKGLSREAIDGSEARAIDYKIMTTEKSYNGKPYLLYSVLPQFYFHVTAAYAILRTNGVKLAKEDYLGEYPKH